MSITKTAVVTLELGVDADKRAVVLENGVLLGWMEEKHIGAMQME